MGLFSEKSTVGIDVTTHSVKLLELSRRGEQFHLVSHAIVPLAKHVVQNDNIKDVEALIEALKLAKEQSGTKAQFANVAVPAASVIHKLLQVDASIDEHDLEAQIRLEADRFVPYPMDEVNLDFEIQGDSSERAGFMDVLVVASRTEVVESRVDAVQAAGFKVKAVDVELYALERASELVLPQLPKEGRDKSVAIIDIGSTKTTLSVMKDLSIFYTREEKFGGDHLTELLHNRFGITLEQAETLKIEHELPGLQAMDQDKISMVLHEEILPHIRRQLQFFFAANETESIEHLLLAGGSAMLVGLSAYLQEQLGISVSIVDPFHSISCSDSVNQVLLASQAARMMVACGLAMRGAMHA